MCNRLNWWNRPFLMNPSHPLTPQGHLDVVGSSYLPSVPLQASPALMVLATSSSSSSSADDPTPSSGTCRDPSAPPSSSRQQTRSTASPSDTDQATPVRPPRHPAFGGGPFPFFRAGDGLPMPPFFSHLHQTLLRSQLDSAAAQLHHAVLDPRRMAASLYGLHSHPSAFLAAAAAAAAAPPPPKKSKYDGGFSSPSDDRHSPSAGAQGQDLSTPSGSAAPGGGVGHQRGVPWTPASSCSPVGDERRSSSAGAMSDGVDADSDVISDHRGDAMAAGTSGASPLMHVGRWTSSGDGSVRLSSIGGGGMGMGMGGGGGGGFVCPVCREKMPTTMEEIQSHLIKELNELTQLSTEALSNGYQISTQDLVRGSSSSFRSNSSSNSREMSSKSRFETYLRIRNNREGRLAKIRNRRKRLHDEMTSSTAGSHVTLANGHNLRAPSSVQRDGDDDMDETIDVIGFEEHDKDCDWLSPSSAAPTLPCCDNNNRTTTTATTHNNNNNNNSDALETAAKKRTEDKSTRTDDVIVDVTKERISCSVCSMPYVAGSEISPRHSSWHVFCQRCWTQTMNQQQQQQQQQCNQSSNDDDLQRI